ncbi:MAG: sigma-70 family RNA polymerase sigma factor [Phycisphaerales bacterium]|nr:hypothetical protein [Phycisphaerales bacterium]
MEEIPITLLIESAGKGDVDAAARLLPLVYGQLRAAAQIQLTGERAGHTLQATALVHEAYLRMVGPGDVPWAGRAHFFAAAAESMRRILIDHARARGAAKRGGVHRKRVNEMSLDALSLTLDVDPSLMLDLDEALRAFESEEPKKAELVKLRFFAGLTLEQAGKALGLSPATADRHWAYARAWLFSRLGGSGRGQSSDIERE